jgi:hypothetical protein
VSSLDQQVLYIAARRVVKVTDREADHATRFQAIHPEEDPCFCTNLRLVTAPLVSNLFPLIGFEFM